MKLWPLGVHGIQDRPITGFGMNVFRKIVLTRYPVFRRCLARNRPTCTIICCRRRSTSASLA